jgi:hypothetical protein
MLRMLELFVIIDLILDYFIVYIDIVYFLLCKLWDGNKLMKKGNNKD